MTVHIWWVPLDAARIPDHLPVLDDAERDRVRRLRSDQARAAFVLTRGVLRRVLGGLLHRPPHTLVLRTGPHGKPALPGTPVHFNVSHSGGLAVVAVSTGGPLGVDVEQHDPAVAAGDLAGRFFAPAEAAALRRLPAGRRQRAFFTTWTRKEAYVKAVGAGLSLDLASFTVGLPPRSEPDLRAADAGRWHLTDLDPGPGYAAALVTTRVPGGPQIRRSLWRHSGVLVRSRRAGPGVSGVLV